MQYMRMLGRVRLAKTILVGLAVCLGTVTAADAGKKHHRHVSARAKAHRVVASSDGFVGSSRYAAFVIDDKTGKVLYAKNADAPRHPASLTKMMTLYLLFEDLQKRKLGLSSRLTASVKASQQAPTKLGLRPGQTIAVEDAIRALVTKSANDVAVTVAENLGGTEADFARRMTSTARRIGMRGSTFYNASGLPNDDQYTTARDMVILGRALQERFPSYYRYFSTRSFAWGNAVHGNHNHLLGRLDGVDGIKTGYTNASGFNLVSSYRQGGRHLVAAVMGGPSAGARDDHMVRLLTTYIPEASAGTKTSSVFDENGATRTADAGDDETPLAALPTPVPERVRTADAEVEPAGATGAPVALVAVSAPAPQPASYAAVRPRIATSDVVPIAAPERETRRSADRGAAVAMARAILLPDAGRPISAPIPAPVRSAAAPAKAAPAVQNGVEPRPTRVASLAVPVVATRDRPVATTGSLPPQRRPAAEPAPLPKQAHKAGWMVQIGAYDSEKAARAALQKAKDKGGSVVGQVDGFTETVGVASGRLWRARFAGFVDQKRAEDACRALKRKDFACLALRQ